MDIAIPKSLEALVRRKVEEGHYTTEAEVVADALRLMQVRDEVATGSSLHASMENTNLFAHMVNQMVAIGEESGSVDHMLGKVADFYEDEVDVAVAGLLTLMEPLMIAFLGGVVGGIVIAMYMPIFGLISKLT